MALALTERQAAAVAQGAQALQLMLHWQQQLALLPALPLLPELLGQAQAQAQALRLSQPCPCCLQAVAAWCS